MLSICAHLFLLPHIYKSNTNFKMSLLKKSKLFIKLIIEKIGIEWVKIRIVGLIEIYNEKIIIRNREKYFFCC